MTEHLRKIIDALHGGLASYDKDAGCFLFRYCSESAAHLLGCGNDQCCSTSSADALEFIYEQDRADMEMMLQNGRLEGKAMTAYFRVKSGKDHLEWWQLNSWKEGDEYFVLFSGIFPEMQLFRNIASETADDVYVVDKNTYQLIYANELKKICCREGRKEGRTCYEILYGRTEPCEFCTMNKTGGEDAVNEMVFEHNGRFFSAKFREMDWNGLDAYVKYVRDITEEVEGRRQKERLEQYFQTVVKYLPGGMAVVRHRLGGDMTPEYLSDGFAEMLDMPIRDAWKMYQENALSGVHPDDRDYVRENLDRCIREKREKYELQYRLRNGNGEYIWVNVKFSVIQSEGGEARVYADYHDITAEKRMQEQLRQQYKDRIIRHYMSAGSDALILGHSDITQDRVLEIVDYTNSGLLERFGDSREGFFTGLGTMIPDENERSEFYEKYLNDPSKMAFYEGVKDIVMPCFMEFPGEKSGKYVQFRVTLVETPDVGDVTGILTVTDITEKKIREKIFDRLSSANYDLVADINLRTDYYAIVSGGDDLLCDHNGVNSERRRQVIDRAVVHNSAERKYLQKMLDPEYMLQRLAEEGSYSFTYSFRNSAGEICVKNMLVSAIDLRLERVCLIRSDVTDVVAGERRAKEEMEKALKKAEKASRVKSDFLSSMSHDIRTPMNAIVGMTNLALANMDSRERVEDYLRKISVSSQHLLSLINDILDMSQIEQSCLHLNLQVIRMEELISRVTSIIMPSAESAGVRFHVETGDFAHAAFLGDMLRINQVLINLLSNAVKFTPEGGTVLLRTEETDARREGFARYRFTVGDTGMGMSEEFLKHLFEPFIRSDTVNRVEGTGLGLSITKGLTDLMGGEIRVRSRLQEGTEFEVELEFEPSEQDNDVQTGLIPDGEEEDLRGYHFLLVEDNEINSEILGELLQMRGATFTVRTDGLQAVNEFCSAEPGTYDAIFMDIQMPVMNGYEATRKIRSLDHPDAESVIILAMTANAFAEDVQEAADAGMDGHIAKPVDMKLLYSTVAELLKKRKKQV